MHVCKAKERRQHHDYASTWCLWGTWCAWTVSVCRLPHQRSTWISTLLQTRWRKSQAVLRGGLHHYLSPQGSLPQTRRRSRRVRVWGLHQPDGEHVEDLHNARRQRVLRILVRRGGCFGKEMLDACNQVGWELPEAHKQVET